jgi:hypothetical protein
MANDHLVTALRLHHGQHSGCDACAIAADHARMKKCMQEIHGDALAIVEWTDIALAPSAEAGDECDHNFVNPENEAVEDNGWEVCTKCGLLRPPPSAEAGDTERPKVHAMGDCGCAICETHAAEAAAYQMTAEAGDTDA